MIARRKGRSRCYASLSLISGCALICARRAPASSASRSIGPIRPCEAQIHASGVAAVAWVIGLNISSKPFTGLDRKGLARQVGVSDEVGRMRRTISSQFCVIWFQSTFKAPQGRVLAEPDDRKNAPCQWETRRVSPNCQDTGQRDSSVIRAVVCWHCVSGLFGQISVRQRFSGG
jgi:hypothetical protein